MGRNSKKGKKGKKGKNSQGRATSSSPKPAATPPKAPEPAPEPPRVGEIKAAHGEAVKASEGTPRAVTSPGSRPSGVDLDALWVMVSEARGMFKAAELRADAAELEAQERSAGLEEQSAEFEEREATLAGLGTELEKRKATIDQSNKELTSRRVTLVSDKEELEKRVRALDQRETELARTDAALAKKESELRARELNAELGFVAERRAMLEVVETELESRRGELRELDEEISEQRASWHEEERAACEAHRRQLGEERQASHAELERTRESREAELEKRAGELGQHEAALLLRGRELDSQARELDYREEELEELRANLDKRVEQRSAATQENYEHRLHSLQAQLEQAQRDRDTHGETLRLREDADRRFGQRTPEQLVAELDKLRVTVKDQELQLADRLDASQTARLRNLEEEQREWQLERQELLRGRSELERRLTLANSDVGEREVQRDVIESLKSQRELLSEAHTQLRSEVDDLLSRSAAISPFPACVAMDEKPELQAKPAAFEGVRDLKEFVEDLRHRIAHDPKHPDRRLYYSHEDLRSFLAGLAMTRLLLLQGLSGTGKTSLPLAFARAVGTPATVIEVQAGWRDPQDLVGHYNTFEKRFDEREFLKALYRAQTPKWEDAVHIVVLDEMNLSHPEQYFSDMLSALERKPEEQVLRLMSHAIAQPPRGLSEDGKLAIPTNVWFVGTANHDETTKDFANKTYDRSHVMELPKRPETFPAQSLAERPPVSFLALDNAFDAAVGRHAKDASKVVEFLDGELSDPLGRDFEIGWGPRLERQLYRYVPVVLAAGGTIGEATDHMLAMRLLRQLKNRHDNRPERLEALKQRIKESWPALDGTHYPKRSIELLNVELARHGRGPEEGA